MSRLKPTILIVATSQWFAPARLAIALATAGCEVEALCPNHNPLFTVGTVRRVHVFRGLAPLKCVRKAIRTSKPNLIIPGDDPAAKYLHELYEEELAKERTETEISSVIERSLGNPSSFSVVRARTNLMNLARVEGIRVPQSEVISNLDALRKWAKQTGFPVVLKANGTSGGDGVRIAHALEKAEFAFQALQAPPLLAKAIKRAFFNHDSTLIAPSLQRKQYVINAQEFIVGREATSAIACWKGQVLAELQFEVVNRQEAGGPSTVLRLIENAEMAAAAKKLASALYLSGVHGLDFILEQGTERSYLIEMNPRATQVGHLTFGAGRDIPAALAAAVTSGSVQISGKISEKDTIALFPGEWIRNPRSAFLQSAFHDVPWEEPELVRVCVQRFKKKTTWFSLQRWVDVASKRFRAGR